MCDVGFVFAASGGDKESNIDEKTRELKSKDDIIVQKDKTIQDKSDSIASLQNEISSLLVDSSKHFCLIFHYLAIGNWK